MLQDAKKLCWLKPYEPGDNGPPDCYSLDGHIPAHAAANKQSAACDGCPQNSGTSKMLPGKRCFNVKERAQ